MTAEPAGERLEAAPHVWLASVRPDGRPHTVPGDATRFRFPAE